MSFLKDYTICTQNNEVPPSYHLYSALVALASLCSSRVWLDRGLFIIRPNLYVILTGDPGVKKTTAMSVAKRLLNIFESAVPMSAESQSKEDLVRAMATKTFVCECKPGEVPDRFAPMDEAKSKFIYSPITVCVTELSEFFGIGAGRMVDFLTTVFDQEYYKHATIKRGDEVLPMPFLNLLSCAVPAWIKSRLNDDIISGGFTSRAMFVYEKVSEQRIAFPDVSEDMEKAWDRLVAHSREIIKLKGPFSWGPGSREFFRNWYEKLKRPTDPVLQGWFNRKDLHMVKLAMLVAISERKELTLNIEDMEVAMAMLEGIEVNIPKVFAGMGRNELFGVASKYLEMFDVADNKTLPERYVKKELLRDIPHITEIAKLLGHLVETNQIKRWCTKDTPPKWMLTKI